VIEINLLPHREARRKAELRQMLLVSAVAAGVLLLGIYLAETRIQNQRAHAEASVEQLESDLARYKPQELKVAEFRKTRTELLEKLAVIRGLDAARTGPVRILEEVRAQTPARLWLTGLRTEGDAITLEGASLDNSVVADFLRNLNGSKHFRNVDLDKTQSGHEVDGVELVNFVITADLSPHRGEQGGA
jgi:type IV pilus assembly protein PilN